jgi:hypothetical protein
MSEKKSLVEEALLSMQNLEEAIAQNAKGILASTMKQEISELVKESLQEQETEDEVDMEDMDAEDAEMDVEMDDEMDTEMDSEDDEMDVEMDTEMDTEIDTEDAEMDDMDTEEPLDLRGLSDDQLIKVFKAMSDEDGIIVTKDGDNIHLEDTDDDVEYMIDLGESEEDEMDESWNESEEMSEESDIDSILDKMFDGNKESDDESVDEESDDEIVYEIHMDEEEEEDDEDEMNESMYSEEEDDEDEMNESMYSEEEDDEDEMNESMYSEEEDDEDEMNESVKKIKKETKESFKKIKPKGVGMGKVKKSVFTQPVKKTEAKEGSIMVKPKIGKGAAKVGGKNTEVFTKKPMGKKSETKEAARTLGNGKKWGRNGLDKPKAAPRHLAVESELKALREKNEEYRKALNIFREKLNEVAVFNSNLAYATRLFTEHSTTKQEKLNILRRFDGVETLKESKSLYKSIKDELSSNEKPLVKESIEKKIEKVQSTGSSINLIESKTYENPQFLRMKDLMSKIK